MFKINNSVTLAYASCNTYVSFEIHARSSVMEGISKHIHSYWWDKANTHTWKLMYIKPNDMITCMTVIHINSNFMKQINYRYMFDICNNFEYQSDFEMTRYAYFST